MSVNALATRISARPGANSQSLNSCGSSQPGQNDSRLSAVHTWPQAPPVPEVFTRGHGQRGYGSDSHARPWLSLPWTVEAGEVSVVGNVVVEGRRPGPCVVKSEQSLSAGRVRPVLRTVHARRRDGARGHVEAVHEATTGQQVGGRLRQRVVASHAGRQPGPVSHRPPAGPASPAAFVGRPSTHRTSKPKGVPTGPARPAARTAVRQ